VSPNDWFTLGLGCLMIGMLSAVVVVGWSLLRTSAKADVKKAVLFAREGMNRTIIAASEDEEQDWSDTVRMMIELHRDEMLRRR